MKNVYYFAYGSCMDEIDFKRTVEQFEVLGSAELKEYRLAFTLYGESRAGGVADIVPSPDSEVQGVLYSFPEQYLVYLDQREGVHQGKYERIELDVWHQGKSVKAYTYQVINKAQEEIAPSLPYVELMLNGMEKFATQEYKNHFKDKLKTAFGLYKMNELKK